MEFSGVISDAAGRPIPGAVFGAMTASGELLFGGTDADADGSFVLSAQPGELVFFGAPGYVTKTFTVPFDVSRVVLNKPFNFAAIGLVAGAAYLVLNEKKRKGVGALGFSNEDVKTVFLIVGGVLALDTITKILRALGFWNDPKSTKLDNVSTDPNSFWNPNYWKQTQNYSYIIDTPTAERFAKQINDALGYFNDDESAIDAVFHQLRTKANVSYLAHVYAQKYGSDLFSALRGGVWPQDGISDEQLHALNAYCETLTPF